MKNKLLKITSVFGFVGALAALAVAAFGGKNAKALKAEAKTNTENAVYISQIDGWTSGNRHSGIVFNFDSGAKVTRTDKTALVLHYENLATTKNIISFYLNGFGTTGNRINTNTASPIPTMYLFKGDTFVKSYQVSTGTADFSVMNNQVSDYDKVVLMLSDFGCIPEGTETSLATLFIGARLNSCNTDRTLSDAKGYMRGMYLYEFGGQNEKLDSSKFTRVYTPSSSNFYQASGSNDTTAKYLAWNGEFVEPASFNLTTDGNGKLEMMGSAYKGKPGKIGITANNHYELDTLLVGGNDVTEDVKNGVYEIAQMPAAGLEAAATFSSHNIEHHEAVSETCETAGNIEYWSCEECGKNYSDAACTQELESIEVEPHAHSMTHHEAVEPTVLTDGSIEYWSCSECGKNYKDSEGKEVASDVVVPKISHNMTHHDAVAPTCTEDGTVEYWSCSDCAKNFADEIGYTPLDSIVDPAKGHSMTHHEMVKPSMNAAGTVEYWSCSECNKNFADENGEVEISELVIDERTNTTDAVGISQVEGWTKGSRHSGVVFNFDEGAKVTPTGSSALVIDYENLSVQKNIISFYLNGFATSGNRINNSSAAVKSVVYLFKGETFVKSYEVANGTADFTIRNDQVADYDKIVVRLSDFACLTEGVEANLTTLFFCARLDSCDTDRTLSDSKGYVHGIYLTEFEGAEAKLDSSKFTQVYTPSASNFYSASGTNDTNVKYIAWRGEFLEAASAKLTSDANGSLEFAGPAFAGKKATLVASGKGHYSLDTLTVNGADVSEDVENGEYEISEMPASGLQASATFKAHTITHINAVSETCESAGNVEYWSCEECGKNYSDEACTQELETVVINPHAHSMTHHDAFEATCTENGSVEYWSCSECGKNYADVTGAEVLESIVVPAKGHSMTHHEAVEATCEQAGSVEYWSCSECEKNFADETGTNELNSVIVAKLDHSMTHHDAVAPSCTEAGTVEYWSCSECNKNYADEEGTEVLESIVDPAKGHSMSHHDAVEATCINDGTVEYWSCSECSKNFADELGNVVLESIVDPAKGHQLTHHEAVDATCDQAGNVEYWSCSECGKNFADDSGLVELGSVVIDRLHHAMTHHDAVAPSCTEAGTVEYWSCSQCGKNYADEAGTMEISTIVDPAAGHQMTHHNAVPATCTQDGTVEYWSCSECDKNFADSQGNVILESIVDPAKGHQLTHHEAVDATCDQAGNVEYWSCSECGKNFADDSGLVELDSVVIDRLDHAMTHHDAVAPSCTEAGTVEYWSCSQCGKNYADEAGTMEISTIVDPANGHAMVHHDAVAATCEQKGSIEYWSCSECGEKFLDAEGNQIAESIEVAALGHTYVEVAEVAATPEHDGVKAHYECSVCGELFVKDASGNYTKVTAESLAIAYVAPQPDPVEPDEPEEPKSLFGCFGSVVASSGIVALVTLTGAALLISKKKAKAE